MQARGNLVYLNCIFQLDTYMDEQFVKAAFASAGHAVISVKIIINKITG